LVTAALEKKVKKFVFTSTGATLPYQLFDEKNAHEINQNYIRTKRLAEIAVYKGADLGLDAVILQPIIVIGPYDYNSYSQIFTAIKSGKIKLALPGRIAFCHARDVARAHVQAFYKGRCHESYVLAGPYTTWLECFREIASVVGVKPPAKTASIRSLMIMGKLMAFASRFTGRPPLMSPDLVRLLRDYGDFSHSERRKAREILGYESSSLNEMIHDCHAWLMKENRI
jgi:nucleoside-diphosphate-sugar epimerase